MKNLFLGIAVFMFATALVLADTDVPADPVMGKVPRDVPAQQLEGFNLSGYSESGQKSWDIKGDKADIQGNEVAVTNVNANSYGDQDLNLTARKGKIDKATGDVDLQEDVVITSDSGTTMKTDTLQWQRSKDLVQTDDKVSIEDGTMTVRGTGMEAHPSLKDAKLRSDVTANILSEGSDKKKNNQIQITSDGPMEIDQATQAAVFTDNVQAVEMSTGRKLKADRMRVTFDEGSRKIKEIFCTGNVELHQGMNITYSDSLTYKADEQRMILTGKPKLIIDPGDRTSEEMFNY
jgi:LPS export ABC transporter protein LptC/lipopolysaccharide transport protein LptA